MKKVFVVCLLFTIFALTGCTKKSNENKPSPETKNISRDEAMIFLDLKTIRVLLEEYHIQYDKYPTKLSPGDKLGSYGWVMPSGTKGETSNCKTNYEYKYSSASDDSYSLTYCLDGNTKTSQEKKLSPGIHTATQDGLWQ